MNCPSWVLPLALLVDPDHLHRNSLDYCLLLPPGLQVPGLNSVCDCCHPASVRLGTGPPPHGQAWGAGSTGQQQDKPTVHHPPELCDPSTWLNLSVPLFLLHRPGSPQRPACHGRWEAPLPPGGSVSIADVRATREAGVSLVGDVPLCGSWSGCWEHSDPQQTFN